MIRWLSRILARAVATVRREPISSGIRKSYQLVHVTDEPDVVEPDRIYAVGEHGHLWHLTFSCPCGCSARISLNALPDDFPCWRLIETTAGPTLSPSIAREVGCRSHFWVRRGRVEWFRANRTRRPAVTGR